MSEGYIYFVGAVGTDPLRVKIGFSVDPKRRLKELQTGTGQRLRLIGYMPGTRELESWLHHAFEDEHLGGEWFAMADGSHLAACTAMPSLLMNLASCAMPPLESGQSITAATLASDLEQHSDEFRTAFADLVADAELSDRQARALHRQILKGMAFHVLDDEHVVYGIDVALTKGIESGAFIVGCARNYANGQVPA